MFPVYEYDRPYTPDPEFVAKADPDEQYIFCKSHLAHLKIIRDFSKDREERNHARNQIDLVLDRLEFWSKRTIDSWYVIEESKKIDRDCEKEMAKHRVRMFE